MALRPVSSKRDEGPPRHRRDLSNPRNPRNPRNPLQQLSLLLWTLLVRFATPALLLRLWLRARREPGYGSRWWERWGWGIRDQGGGSGGLEGTDQRVWLHAVSLGETHACVPLMQAWLEHDPSVRFLLTHMTATGRAAGLEIATRAEFAGRVEQAWLPYDTPGAVRRFLRVHRPGLGVLMETEVWPNLIAQCADAGVPMALVNARLSPRSLRRAQRIRWLIEPALASLAAIVAQTPRDAERLRTLGVDGALIAGNLKFDRPVDAALSALGRQWRAGLSDSQAQPQSGRQVILAASTRDGEEADLLAGLHRKSLWVIVPRHPQRFDAVAEQIQAHGFQLVRRSKDTDWAQAEVILGDSMGEMTAWYAMADVAILGGSLRPFGGQNLIEAAAVGCPVVLGPHTFNFAQAAEDAVECGAALRATTAAHALELAQSVAENPSQRTAMSLSALAWVASHRGATQRTLRALVCLLPSGPT